MQDNNDYFPLDSVTRTIEQWIEDYRCQAIFSDPETGYPLYCLDADNRAWLCSSAINLLRNNLIPEDSAALVMVRGIGKPFRVPLLGQRRI